MSEGSILNLEHCLDILAVIILAILSLEEIHGCIYIYIYIHVNVATLPLTVPNPAEKRGGLGKGLTTLSRKKNRLLRKY